MSLFFFFLLSKLLLDSSLMRTEYPGGGTGEKSLDAKSVQCSILLGGNSNARFVHLRLVAHSISLYMIRNMVLICCVEGRAMTCWGGPSGEILDFRWAILDEAKAPYRPSSVRARLIELSDVDVRAWVEIDKLANWQFLILYLRHPVRHLRGENFLIRSSMTFFLLSISNPCHSMGRYIM